MGTGWVADKPCTPFSLRGRRVIRVSRVIRVTRIIRVIRVIGVIGTTRVVDPMPVTLNPKP